jgi:hypothetical protein
VADYLGWYSHGFFMVTQSIFDDAGGCGVYRSSMTYILTPSTGCCGQGKLYAEMCEVPVIGDEVFTSEHDQYDNVYRKYTIIDVTDKEITCIVTDLTACPDETYLNNYVRPYLQATLTEVNRFCDGCFIDGDGGYIPLDESFVNSDGRSIVGDDGNEYLQVNGVYYRDGRLYARNMHRDEVIARFAKTIPYQVGTKRVFKR